MKKNRYVAYMGLLLAAAVLLGYVEALIPIDLMIPGVKLGLANCAILFALYSFGLKEALIISLLRTLIIGVIFTSPAMLIYSISGAAVSLLIMAIIKKSGHFSVFAVSACGGISHNITQLIIAGFVMLNAGAGLLRILTFYLPVLVMAGIITGLLNAFFANILIKRISVHSDTL